VARNVSAINFFDGYRIKAKITSGEKDSIASLLEGAVMGPYLEGADYILAKKVSTKILPDSIRCRHILLGTSDPQTGQPLIADSVAKQKIDSIETAIKNGANFNTLEAEYSTDKVAHKDQGVMTFDLDAIQGENFAKEFGDFLLNENGETKKAVHTQFGWHYIEILEKKNPQPAYKVAYLAREIVPSDETINAANAAATKLAGESRSEKDFDANIKKPGNGLWK
jgi:peptidyl-prolyl cis-trans isomerase D